MREEGTIVRWDSEKGFGFIRGRASAQDVFLHVRDFRCADGNAPRQGLLVAFDRIDVGGKGPRAIAAAPAAQDTRSTAPAQSLSASSPRIRSARRQRQATASSGAMWVLPLVAAYALCLVAAAWQRQVSWWVLPASLFLNAATFMAYWHDKYAAASGRWRVRESTLHGWSLAGGWVGGWFAQQLLRHKSAKASFRNFYWATVLAHCAAASGFWWFTRHH